MRRIIFAAILLSLSAAVAECAEEYEAVPGLIIPGGFTVFFNSQGPLSYETLSPGEIPRDAVDVGKVKCTSCQHGLSFPITTPSLSSRGTNISGAQGNGSFQKALENLKLARPDVRGIYDVKVDYHKISVLGIYKRLCTEVTARGYK